MSSRRLTVRRLGALGAEISGHSPLASLDDGETAAIRAIWLEHQVVFFRDACLSPGELVAFAKRFGEPMDYPFLKGLDGFPLVTEIKKHAHETVNFGGIWHSDTSYLPEPPMATMLIARTVPPYGGDTLFANCALAYETLSIGLKRMLAGLVGVNTSARADTTRTREDRMCENAREDVAKEYVAEHPVVRTHPETGHKSLYVSPAHTVRFRDMTEEESAPVLGYLFEHMVRPEFTCRFCWNEGALALWDNRCTLHNPVNDYHRHERVMQRVTLRGDPPV
jgi:taurine dioxygenase